MGTHMWPDRTEHSKNGSVASALRLLATADEAVQNSITLDKVMTAKTVLLHLPLQ